MNDPKNEKSGLPGRPQSTPVIVPEAAENSTVQVTPPASAYSVNGDGAPERREAMRSIPRPIVEVSPIHPELSPDVTAQKNRLLPGRPIIEMSPDISVDEQKDGRELREFMPTQSARPIVEVSPEVGPDIAADGAQAVKREFLPMQASRPIVEMSPDIPAVEAQDGLQERLQAKIKREIIVEVSPDVAVFKVEEEIEVRETLSPQSVRPIIIVEVSPDVAEMQGQEQVESREVPPARYPRPIIVEVSPEVGEDITIEVRREVQLQEFAPTQASGKGIGIIHPEVAPDMADLEPEKRR